jgi:hypothetical protein
MVAAIRAHHKSCWSELESASDETIEALVAKLLKTEV